MKKLLVTISTAFALSLALAHTSAVAQTSSLQFGDCSRNEDASDPERFQKTATRLFACNIIEIAKRRQGPAEDFRDVCEVAMRSFSINYIRDYLNGEISGSGTQLTTNQAVGLVIANYLRRSEFMKDMRQFGNSMAFIWELPQPNRYSIRDGREWKTGFRVRNSSDADTIILYVEPNTGHIRNVRQGRSIHNPSVGTITGNTGDEIRNLGSRDAILGQIRNWIGVNTTGCP